jgi:hypothetical protein
VHPLNLLNVTHSPSQFPIRPDPSTLTNNHHKPEKNKSLEAKSTIIQHLRRVERQTRPAIFAGSGSSCKSHSSVISPPQSLSVRTILSHDKYLMFHLSTSYISQYMKYGFRIRTYRTCI